MKLPPYEIYLAGKIRKNCWRHKLVPGLRSSSWGDLPLDCGDWLYVGPFFVGCDHGCYHVPTGHGSVNPEIKLCGDDYSVITRAEVRARCLKGINQCDVLVAYIDEHQCYGTVAEIQYALNLGKNVLIAFAPEIATQAENEFWFVSDSARWVHFDVTDVELSVIIDDLFWRSM